MQAGFQPLDAQAMAANGEYQICLSTGAVLHFATHT